MATLQEALARFGIVTVMDASFYAEGVYSGTPLFTLDTLRISNFTQEGPRKTAKGGINAETIFRYGKTARLEMEDVVGRIAALEKLMGVRKANLTVKEDFEQIIGTVTAGQTVVLTHVPDPLSLVIKADPTATALTLNTDYTINGQFVTFTGPETTVVATYDYTTPDTYKITEEFEGKYTIKGRTFVIDQATGDREYINIIIHKFLPDSLFNMTMEAEGDFGVISMAGELFTNDCGVFYELTKEDNPAGCP